MVRELMQDLKTYFNNIKNPSERERQLLKQLNAGYFVITSVHRNDLARTGFDVERSVTMTWINSQKRWQMIIATNYFGKAWKQ
ncbi:hypothetical protein [Bacteroides faecis]|uniref:hypothetical protein n=1 Tax=Bacteroides faecis TaxID=674529 RepID=UPI002164061F|nr:hypothetical protein [Bacteroides faecis]UVS48659.1 hypothetical protein NXW99_25900 [Bacteroides faecis]